MLLAVIGGTVLDSALDPVVALAADGEAFCTGVVVAPDWVLTAAHCVTAAGSLASPVVAWTGDLSDGAEVRAWTDAVRHPDADEVTHAHDLALLLLDAPAHGSAAALGDAPAALGEDVAIYGFGTPVEGRPADGVKRGAVLAVEDVGEDLFLAFAPDANACSGDSGGPAVAERDGGWVVVGIDTFVDPACLGGRTGSTRVDVDLAWIGSVAGDLVTEPLMAAAGAQAAARGCATAGAGGTATLLAVALARRRPARRPRGAAGMPRISTRSASGRDLSLGPPLAGGQGEPGRHRPEGCVQISDPEPRRFVTPPARGDVPAIGSSVSNRPPVDRRERPPR